MDLINHSLCWCVRLFPVRVKSQSRFSGWSLCSYATLYLHSNHACRYRALAGSYEELCDADGPPPPSLSPWQTHTNTFAPSFFNLFASFAPTVEWPEEVCLQSFCLCSLITPCLFVSVSFAYSHTALLLLLRKHSANVYLNAPVISRLILWPHHSRHAWLWTWQCVYIYFFHVFKYLVSLQLRKSKDILTFHFLFYLSFLVTYW